MASFALEHLTFSYPGQTRPALDDLTLTIPEGAVTVLCGESGSGKSTLLRQLKTCLTPHGETGGTVRFGDALLKDIPFAEQARRIGFVLQHPDDQIVTDKVFHELAFGLESLGCDEKTMRLRVAEMASYFGIADWFERDVQTLAPELLRAAQSPLHWLLQSALLDRDERYLRRNYVYLKADAAAERTEAEAEPTLPEPDPALLAQLERALTFHYAHAQATELPSKVTATELKRLEPENTPPEDAGAPLLKGAPRTQVFRQPDFSVRERRLTAAERGTATHRTLQYLRFAGAQTPESIAAQVQALAAHGQLTAREAQAVNTASLLQLMRTPLGTALAAAEAAGTLRREFRFSLLCPAETFFPGAGAEQVLLQGVVDAWFETPDGLVIVDYKTDRIRPDAVPERTAYYAAQLRAYAGAMARITGRPVCRRTLYFLHCGCSADVPESDA